MATAMSGGTAYLLKSTTATDGSTNIKLYLYIVPTWNSSTRKTTTKLGLYVNSNYNIGAWSDYGDSKLYNTAFSGPVPASTKGNYWLVSGVTGPTYTHDGYGNTTAVKINWYWDVHSTWGGFNNANGSYSYTAAKQAAKTYTVTFNANGGSLDSVPATITKTHGVDYTITTSKPKRTGYTFKEWNTKSDGTGYSLAAGGKINGNESKTMYAIWTINSYKITYNANGGTPATTTKSLNYNTAILSNAPTVTRSGYALNGWYTATSGGTKVTSTTKVGTADKTYYAQWDQTISDVTVPTSLTATANNDNTVTVSCKAPADATGNQVTHIELFVTYDGTTPSVTNYNYTCKVDADASQTCSKVISLKNFSVESIGPIFGDDYVGTFNVKARTLGAAGASYYSGLTANASTRLTWHGPISKPTVLTPAGAGDVWGDVAYYPVRFSCGASGINNTITGHKIRVYDVTAAANLTTVTSTITSGSSVTVNVPADIFAIGHTYQFFVTAVGTYSGFDSLEAPSGYLVIKDIEPFAPPLISTGDGNTIPSTEIYGTKMYVDIGSGDICRLYWSTPTAANNILSGYILALVANGNTIFSKDIGKVNEFYITSEMLPENHNLAGISVFLTPVSQYGGAYVEGSGNATILLKRGCGLYTKVTEGYKQPIMKRALAFIKKVDGTWVLASEVFAKDINSSWRESDIKYEVLTDANGEVINFSGEPIYTL